MATAILSRPVRGLPAPSTPRFVSIGKAADLTGLSIQTLREWSRQGRITAYTTAGNHRRYRSDQLLKEALGVTPESENGSGRKVAAYCRCSTVGQKDSLARQVERVCLAVCEREGIEREDIYLATDLCSSFGDRKGLNKLISEIVAGRISKFYVSHFDRLSRVPSLTRLIEHLCRQNNCEIIAIEQDEELDQQKQNMQELIEFVSVLSVRQQAQRAADRKRKVLSVEALDYVRKQMAAGLAIKHAVDAANNAGHRTEKGELLSYRVVQRYMTKVVPKLAPLENVDETSIEKFWKAHVSKRKGNMVAAGAIHVAYNDWAQKNGIEPMSAWKCGAWLRKNGDITAHTQCGYVYYEGIAISGYSSVMHNKGEWAKKYDNGIQPLTLTYLGRKGSKKGFGLGNGGGQRKRFAVKPR